MNMKKLGQIILSSIVVVSLSGCFNVDDASKIKAELNENGDRTLVGNWKADELQDFKAELIDINSTEYDFTDEIENEKHSNIVCKYYKVTYNAVLSGKVYPEITRMATVCPNDPVWIQMIDPYKRKK